MPIETHHSIIPFESLSITSFSFLKEDNDLYLISDIESHILGQNITLEVPYGTDTSSLIASFSTTGDSVTVNGIEQESDETINDFSNSETNPVVYSVEADDGTIADYNVRVEQKPWLSFLYSAGSGSPAHSD